MSIPDPVLAARYRALALKALGRPAAPFLELPSRCLIVDVGRQRLGFLEAGRLLGEWHISTAAKGIGGEEGSFRTPPDMNEGGPPGRFAPSASPLVHPHVVSKQSLDITPGWHRVNACIGEGAVPGALFRDRVPTGEVWKGEAGSEDLILTRILTLEGCEEGVNRGPGQDSLARFIYIHGTNQESRLGSRASHGCIRMANAEVVELFDRVRDGDALVVVPDPDEQQDRVGLGRLHFAGVGGSGMSALAQYAVLLGGRVSGSDRSFDGGQRLEARGQLERLGVRIVPQDGSAVSGDCSAVIYSTAVEEQVPDFAEARRLGVPLLHRSELLAHFVATRRTLAITGTSGKSTTVAMTFEILRGAGLDPSVITGGELRVLQQSGLWGNAWAGGSDLLVVEADESDGSLVRYHPAVGVVLNLQRDHKEMDVVAGMFRTFRDQVQEALIVGEADNLVEFHPGATVFGFGAGARFRAEGVEERSQGCAFRVDGTPFQLSVPGRHNAENALAAMAACAAVGVSLEAMVAPLAAFQGVARRFEVLGTCRGVQVVDDFGHNPAKVTASLRTAHGRSQRVLAVFQPHGYGPLRFLRQEFVAAFAAELAPQDRLWMLEVFFAGGTAQRDLSSADVVAEIAAQGAAAAFAPSRDWLVERMAAEAREGDLVLVMGARDPSLTALAQAILARLELGKPSNSGI